MRSWYIFLLRTDLYIWSNLRSLRFTITLAIREEKMLPFKLRHAINFREAKIWKKCDILNLWNVQCVCFQILGLFFGEEQILCCWLLRPYAILYICTTSSVLCVDLFASFGIYWIFFVCRPVSLSKSHKICSSLEFLLYTKYLHAQSCLTSRALKKIK